MQRGRVGLNGIWREAALVAAATMIVLLLLLLQRGVRRCLSAQGPSAEDDPPIFSCTQQRTNSGTRNTTVQQPQDTSVVMNCVNSGPVCVHQAQQNLQLRNNPSSTLKNEKPIERHPKKASAFVHPCTPPHRVGCRTGPCVGLT